MLNCEDDFDKLQIDADIYCTGSDQTWNSGWYGRILKSYFLTFCPDNIKKISYAASFGKTSLEDSEKEEIRKYLLRYAAISLREESGVKIIEELGISGSVHVLYLQPIITQYFIDNKSEIWLLFLIAHSKR